MALKRQRNWLQVYTKSGELGDIMVMQFEFSYTAPFVFMPCMLEVVILPSWNMVAWKDLTVMVEKTLSERWMSTSHGRGVRASFQLPCWGKGKKGCNNDAFRVKGRHLVKVLISKQLMCQAYGPVRVCIDKCSNQTMLEP